MGLVLVDEGLEDLAGLDIAVHVMAVVHGILKSFDDPAVHEVCVEGEATGVSAAENVGAVAPIVELVGGDDHLVEEADGVNGMGRRARSRVVVVDRVGHM